MSWFVFELRREGYTMTELEEFPLAESAFKHAIEHLMMLTRGNRRVSIGVGEVTAGHVDWLGELHLDPEGLPAWNSDCLQLRALEAGG
jgi:hypothetical protein